MQKGLSSQQKAYLAGFIDGDGSIYVQAKQNTSYRYGFQIAPYIVLFQSAKDRINFQNLCSLIGIGYMRERKDGILEYIINRQEAILEILSAIGPHVILKRKQVSLMLQILDKKEKVADKNDFIKLLSLVDQFRAINYSKKRKKRRLTP